MAHTARGCRVNDDYTECIMRYSLDTIVATLAPHYCLVCSREGDVVCADCLLSAGNPIEPRCAGCKKLSDGYRTCRSCTSWLSAYSVIVASSYDGVYEQMLRAYKFDGKRPAVHALVELMRESSRGLLRDDALVTWVPTTSNRIRMRGFDHAKLLATTYARTFNYPVKQLLHRTTNTRQLGASRKKRMHQMKQAFEINNPTLVVDKNIVLIDDTITTGASIAAATKLLKNCGAKRIQVVTFTQSD